MMKFIAAIAFAEFAGIIGSLATISNINGWYAGLKKPALNPPDWVFGPVWTMLYFLMGVALYLVWKNDWKVRNHIFERTGRAWNVYSEWLWTGSWQKVNVIAIFSIQLFLNALWSFLFFRLHAPGLAFVDLLALWAAILYTIINFYRISKAAAYLLIPYILWVSFAGYLNYSIWQLSGNVPEAVQCTLEAKLCPDGSAVGRTGPHCEFALCPGEAK